MLDSLVDNRENTIDWFVTRDCNYDCSYCRVGSHAVKKNVCVDNIDAYFDVFRSLDKSFEIIFSGGEPLIVSNLSEIFQRIARDTPHHIGIVTNLSLSDKKIIQILKTAKDRISWIVGSLHLEYTSAANFLRKSRNINRYLQTVNRSMGVVSVARKDKLSELAKIGDMFLYAGIDFKLQPQVGGRKGGFMRYNKVEKGIIEKFGRGFGLHKTDFQGHVCYAGIDYLAIDERGDVFRCHTARRRGKDDPGYLGNIPCGTFARWQEPRKCIYPFCSCATPRQRKMIVGLNS